MVSLLKKKLSFDENIHHVKKLLRSYSLSTVCEEARCPNIQECFSKNHITFMILGDRCTRNCRFCNVSSGSPLPPDEREPFRIAEFVRKLGIRYVVITSVTRDDLPDGGALHFFKTVKAIKNVDERINVEILTPDFRGMEEALHTIVSSGADVFAHNIETVKRLYPEVRPSGDYETSLNVLRFYKRNSSGIIKSGLMVGLGENEEEVYEVIEDLKGSGCDVVVIGQYFQPCAAALPVREYVPVEVLEKFVEYGKKLGMRVLAGRYYRSSYRVEEGNGRV